MSIIRQDPTTKEWVIISTQRAKRPHDFKKRTPPRKTPPSHPSCPFCPGNEIKTPHEIYRFLNGEKGDWTVRVVPNKFSALETEGEPKRREFGKIFKEMDGVGAHEVIIESPLHNRFIAQMTDEEMERILLVYKARYRALRDDPRIRYIIIFKNHGETAGTSLEHPHSQLIATPIAPSQVRRKFEVAIGHYDDTGRCLYRDLVAEELYEKSRIVLETGLFVVFHPFASRVPFETWVMPKRHQPSFGQLSDSEVSQLGKVLKRTLYMLDQSLGDPDYNYIVHSAPIEDENKPYYLWHIQILPRINTIAGFELGSGISISTVFPEQSADYLRNFNLK